MFKSYKIVLILLLVVSLNVDLYRCQKSLSISVSWIYRGNALLNNTVLTFNKDDTLNLACSASADSLILFALTSGSAPPNNINITREGYRFSLTYSNVQTIIYDDYYGVYGGFENIVVLSKNYLAEEVSKNFKIYVSIAVLRPTDARTYFCIAAVPLVVKNMPTKIGAFANSGAVTIQVNTKPGQARSTRANARNFLTYSYVLLSASKLLF